MGLDLDKLLEWIEKIGAGNRALLRKLIVIVNVYDRTYATEQLLDVLLKVEGQTKLSMLEVKLNLVTDPFLIVQGLSPGGVAREKLWELKMLKDFEVVRILSNPQGPVIQEVEELRHEIARRFKKQKPEE